MKPAANREARHCYRHSRPAVDPHRSPSPETDQSQSILRPHGLRGREGPGGKVRIGHITWCLLKGLWLEVDGFEITDASAIPVDFKNSRIHAGVIDKNLLFMARNLVSIQ